MLLGFPLELANLLHAHLNKLTVSYGWMD